MVCKKCNQIMNHVMSFYDGKAYEFNRCPHCKYESKQVPLIFKDEKVKKINTDNKKNKKKKGKK